MKGKVTVKCTVPMASGKCAAFFKVIIIISLTRIANFYHKRALYNFKKVWKKVRFCKIIYMSFQVGILSFFEILGNWGKVCDFTFWTYMSVIPSCCLFPDNTWIYRFNSSNIKCLLWTYERWISCCCILGKMWWLVKFH